LRVNSLGLNTEHRVSGHRGLSTALIAATRLARSLLGFLGGLASLTRNLLGLLAGLAALARGFPGPAPATTSHIRHSLNFIEGAEELSLHGSISHTGRKSHFGTDRGSTSALSEVLLGKLSTLHKRANTTREKHSGSSYSTRAEHKTSTLVTGLVATTVFIAARAHILTRTRGHCYSIECIENNRNIK
jgi:hypothetical protein